MCVCVRARAYGCTRVLNMTHVFAGVCLWKKPGQAKGGENVSEIYKYISYCYFNFTFLSLEPMCQRKIFIFMLCIMIINKDLFD